MLTFQFRADGSYPRFHHDVVDLANGSQRNVRKAEIKLHYGAGKEKIARFSVLEHAAQGFIKSRKVSCCSVEMFLLE